MPHPRTTVEPRRTPESPALREDPLLDPKFRLPSPPADLVVRLKDALGENDLAVAKTGDQPHPVFALVRRRCREGLEAFLAQGGRKIDAWYASLKVVEVSFDDEAEAFRNINTPEELAKE